MSEDLNEDQLDEFFGGAPKKVKPQNTGRKYGTALGLREEQRNKVALAQEEARLKITQGRNPITKTAGIDLTSGYPGGTTPQLGIHKPDALEEERNRDPLWEQIESSLDERQASYEPPPRKEQVLRREQPEPKSIMSRLKKGASASEDERYSFSDMAKDAATAVVPQLSLARDLQGKRSIFGQEKEAFEEKNNYPALGKGKDWHRAGYNILDMPFQLGSLIAGHYAEPIQDDFGEVRMPTFMERLTNTAANLDETAPEVARDVAGAAAEYVGAGGGMAYGEKAPEDIMKIPEAMLGAGVGKVASRAGRTIGNRIGRPVGDMLKSRTMRAADDITPGREQTGTRLQRRTTPAPEPSQPEPSPPEFDKFESDPFAEVAVGENKLMDEEWIGGPLIDPERFASKQSIAKQAARANRQGKPVDPAIVRGRRATSHHSDLLNKRRDLVAERELRKAAAARDAAAAQAERKAALARLTGAESPKAKAKAKKGVYREEDIIPDPKPGERRLYKKREYNPRARGDSPRQRGESPRQKAAKERAALKAAEAPTKADTPLPARRPPAVVSKDGPRGEHLKRSLDDKAAAAFKAAELKKSKSRARDQALRDSKKRALDRDFESVPIYGDTPSPLAKRKKTLMDSIDAERARRKDAIDSFGVKDTPEKKKSLPRRMAGNVIKKTADAGAYAAGSKVGHMMLGRTAGQAGGNMVREGQREAVKGAMGSDLAKRVKAGAKRSVDESYRGSFFGGRIDAKTEKLIKNPLFAKQEAWRMKEIMAPARRERAIRLAEKISSATGVSSSVAFLMAIKQINQEATGPVPEGGTL